MRSRPRRIAALAAACLVVLGTAACASSAHAGRLASRRTATIAPLRSADPRSVPWWAASFATAAIATDIAPNGMTEADGAIWVAAHRGGDLDRIDPVTNTVTDRVVSGGELQLPVTMFGGVWVISSAREQLVRLDPTTRQLTGGQLCVCQGGTIGESGNMVVASFGPALTLYDPHTMKPIRSANVSGPDGQSIYGWTVAGDNMWMLAWNGSKIYRVSLKTLKVTLAVPMSALSIEYIHGRLLIIDGSGRLRQIDPARGTVTRSWQLDTPDKQDLNSGVDIFDDGAGNGVWVNQLSTELTHVDFQTGKIRKITGLPPQPEVNPYVLVADGAMWVADWKDNLVLRMKP